MSMARPVAIALAVVAVAMIAAACGGGASDTSTDGGPKLAGTPIPTVPLPTPTETVCSPPTPMTLPADFPAEIPVPPDYQVWSVTESPYLTVVGRTTPPVSPERDEVPHGVVAQSLLDILVGRGWRPSINKGIDGLDYNVTAPDGRVVHFNALNKPECFGSVQLTYDLKWITP